MTKQDAASRSLPLEGIKVLDLSRVLAGPWATMSLADLGAEVWKIESVDGGDDTRAWSVPSYKGISTYYLCANRGKRSLAIDLKSPQGLEIVHRLARHCDVVVENFRVGTAERLKVGYEQLREINPRIVYCSISGYGRDTTEARRPGYDFIAQAESGLMAITGEKDGEPLRYGIAITDVACGMIATQAILAALFQRERTGEGQHLDVSLMDCALNLLINVGSGFLNSETEIERYGNAHPTVVPYQIFECADGSFALAVGTDRQFQALCRAVIGKPDLSEDPRFRTANGRARHRAVLIPILEEVFRTGTRKQWMEACIAAEVPAGIVKSVSEALNNETVRQRSLIQTLTNRHLGPIKLIRPAHGLAAQKKAEYLAPPLLGEDTYAILNSVLGYSHTEIVSLEAAGAIATFKSAEPESVEV
ncbi:CoA transferase [Mesorhizobium sp.]|uniref:CaiB/BaiF CoA transferase family protein n=1 Tax=Mesorhizobium sp. TaxID=1871066 RepID=UPI00257D5E71|nr:CoA transferase [Mesorhizobium sp.]